MTAILTPSEFILKTSKEYALYVATTRAIPRVNDGLKYVQRVALWLLRNKAEKVKTVALGGEMAKEKLYVHGDVSATDAISKLAAPYKNNVMLVKGHGQFGSRVAPVEGIGAPRYTEVARSKAAEQMLYPDCEILPMFDNYDGSNVIPDCFAPILPLVLLNGVSGVAVGWSTNILPRSLSGLLEATQDALAGKEKLRGLTPRFARYDVDVKAIGPNQYEYTGKASVTDSSTITITELPPGVSLEAFRKRLIEMEDKEQITTFADRSTDKINVDVRFKRGSVKDWTPKQAIDFFKLREKETERIVVLDWNGTRIMTYTDPEQLVRDFVSWRLGWYRKRYEEMIRRSTTDLSYWDILKVLFAKGFAKKLGTFADRAEMEVEIRTIVLKAKDRGVDAELMERVVALPTYRWTKSFGDEIEKKIQSINADIIENNAVLTGKGRLEGIYAKELDSIKKAKLE